VILSGNGMEYDSDDLDYYALSHMCSHIDGNNPIDDAPELMSSD
jgi:CRISPR/Cas system CSM-associated protein Csm5 (group 7 of RAMP superfamily)